MSIRDSVLIAKLKDGIQGERRPETGRAFVQLCRRGLFLLDCSQQERNNLLHV